MTACACGKPLGNRRAECRSCLMRRMNANPEFQQRRIKGLRASPKLVRGSPARLTAARRAGETKKANPALMAFLRDRFRTVIQPLSTTPENLAKRDDVARGKAVSAKKMAWCPEEYRPLYRLLMRSKGMRKADAQRLVFEQIRADEAKLSPFERQERALANGAKLIANSATPSAYAAQAKWRVG